MIHNSANKEAHTMSCELSSREVDSYIHVSHSNSLHHYDPVLPTSSVIASLQCSRPGLKEV